MNNNQDLLSVTAFFSALLHAVVILGISFKLPEIASRPNTDNTLDVILLNASNNEKPQDADIVSSKDNAGGGTDEKEASSPLPYIPLDPSPVQSIKKVANQQTINTQSPDQYITARHGEITVQRQTPDKTRLKAQDSLTGKDIITTKSQRQLRMERLAAKIAQNQEDYNKRPRKEYLSPTTVGHGAAEYLAQWKQRVVTVGNANYPIQAKAKNLTGTLILTVEINSNGTISALNVENPSKHKLLNDAAKRFVRDASPFSSFPDTDYFKKFDVLVITRAFHFLPGNRLTSTAAPQR